MRPAVRRLLMTLVPIWLVITVVGEIIFAIAPFPPGNASNVAQSVSDTTRFITLAAWPIFTGVIVGIIGALLVARRDPDAPLASARTLRGHPRAAGAWIGIVSAIVLALAVIGTLTLSSEEAAEALGVGGRGTANGTNGGNGEYTNLEVQVIAQQWQFTYRYPSFGGMESARLVLPVGAHVTFHITSLDVIHSFWFEAMAVKADAVPEHDNTFSVQPMKVGKYLIVCSELCGLWHGAMQTDSAEVMSVNDFANWASQTQQEDAPVMKYLPPYSYTYVPAPAAYGT